MPDAPDYAAMSYEQLVAALEALTNRLASDEIGIEDAADLFEEAGRLHALASERLARVRERIELLQARDPGVTPEAPSGS
jgi:exodeoxyribonuclease VII small subunit